jgi:glycolate oxidase
MDAIQIEALKQLVGEENCSTSLADLYTYGSDASVHQSRPEIVIRPRCVEHVSKILAYANTHRIPVVPRGAGTGLSGNAVPVAGGIVLDMTMMDRILEINIRDLYVKVEPGVVNDVLNAELEKLGFFFPPTPASGNVATIGGMIGNNASGMRAGKYGATRDAVLGLTVVLPTGEVIEVGARTSLKMASGYHLEKLFVGSEGTLGVVVEATLKILPLPESRAIVLASFDNLEKAGECVANIMSSRLMPSAIEIIDNVCIRAVNKSMGIGLPDCEAILLIEADGHPVAVKSEIEKLSAICKATGAIKVDVATDPNRMAELWKGRKAVLPALSRLEGGLASMSLADDMNVPLSKVPDTIRAFQEAAKKHNIVIGTYGHAGTGNLHTKVLFDPTSKSAWARARAAIDDVYNAVLNAGGICSGEHGVALSKAPYMKKERSDTLALMRAIKRTLDPNNILNPHKIMDAPDDFLRATPLRYPLKVS